MAVVLANLYGLWMLAVLMFLYLPCCGIAYPSAAAIALAPFSKNIGSASALCGVLQMGIGVLASTGVGLPNSKSILPIFVVMAATAGTGLIILVAGTQKTTIKA